jgi:pimeloyl-ACP methyl ester carboxylesterase
MYDELLKACHEMGYRDDEQPGRPRTLWIFVYDWTRSNQDSGQELAGFIRDHVLRTHNSLHPEEPCDDVDVVSHSMGGIVTRAAIQSFQAPIRRAVTSASPHFGTPLAYFALQPEIGLTPALGLFTSLMGDVKWGRFFRQSEDERRLEAQLRWVAARLPSVFELLPDEFYLTDERPMVIVRSGLTHASVTGPADTYWINPVSRFVDREHRRRAMEAMAFKSQLGRRLPEERLVIYSNTEVTPDQVVYRLGGRAAVRLQSARGPERRDRQRHRRRRRGPGRTQNPRGVAKQPGDTSADRSLSRGSPSPSDWWRREAPAPPRVRGAERCPGAGSSALAAHDG